MPLKVEVYANNKWIGLLMLKPGDRPGSISDIASSSIRDVYIFECKEDGSLSTVYKSLAGVDVADERIREIHSAGQRLIRVLGRGDEPYEMTITTERSSEPRKIRFTHV